MVLVSTRLLEGAKELKVSTEYGKPSDSLFLGSIGDRKVAFLPRHGRKHNLPPHRVPYRANIQALHDVGVKRIIATNAVGSLNLKFRIGQIVAFDQFVNQTHGRDDTFFESSVAHISTANPYCTELRRISKSVANRKRLDYTEKGTIVVVNGPRFSTNAESLFFRRQGFDLINMTQYPEVVLAREKCMCYLALAIVTDYDAGLFEGKTKLKPVSHEQVMKEFSKNVEKVKSLVKHIVEDTPAGACATAQMR